MHILSLVISGAKTRFVEQWRIGFVYSVVRRRLSIVGKLRIEWQTKFINRGRYRAEATETGERNLCCRGHPSDW
jgi:hypothetical protein